MPSRAASEGAIRAKPPPATPRSRLQGLDRGRICLELGCVKAGAGALCAATASLRCYGCASQMPLSQRTSAASLMFKDINNTSDQDRRMG